MRNGMKIALLSVTAIAITSSVLFFNQRGFGGGHGDFDKIIFILGLPWATISWPKFFMKHDFVWLIGLPFALNVVSVLVITAVVRMVRRRSGSVPGERPAGPSALL